MDATTGSISARPTLFRFLAAHPYSIAVGLVFFIYAAPFMLRTNGDWEGCFLLKAGQLWAGDTVYDDLLYPYPPFPAFLAVPFLLMPAWLSWPLWYAVNVAAMIFFVRWAWQLSLGGRLEGAERVPWQEHLIFGLGLLCGGRLAWNCLSHHQLDILIGAALAGGCLAWVRGRSFLGATCFGLAAAVKGPALLMAPYMLWRGNWKEAIWVGVVFLAVNTVPSALIPAQHDRFLFGEWVQRFTKPVGNAQEYPDTWTTDTNQSLTGMAYRLGLTTWAWTGTFEQRLPLENPPSRSTVMGVLATSMGILMLASLAILSWRRWNTVAQGERDEKMRHAIECSMVVMLMLLLSPMSNKPHFGAFLLPGFCLARVLVESRSRVLGVLYAAVLVSVLVTQNFLGEFVVGVSMWYGSLTWGTLLLWMGCSYALVTQGKAATVDGWRLSARAWLDTSAKPQTARG